MIRFPTIWFLFWGVVSSSSSSSLLLFPSVAAFVGNNNNIAHHSHHRQQKVVTPKSTIREGERSSCLLLFASSEDSNNGNSSPTNNSKDYDGFPQLPAIGASSFDPSLASTSFTPSSSKRSSSSTMKTTDRAFVGSKLELQYTCKVCGTRNCHRVSRIAYQKGLVIATCKGCMGQHLIADHLGWTKHFDGNIEDYLPEQGSEVNRVNEEVFELEKLLNIDTKSGSIVDDKGNRTME